MPVTYTSRIDAILDRVEREAPEAVADTTRQIAAAARASVAVDKTILKRNIRVTGQGLSQAVEAGRAKGRGFYAHMVEFGTVRTPAQPFLVPAAEAQRLAFRRRLAELYS